MQGDDPRWDSRNFPAARQSGSFVTLASGRAEAKGVLYINSEARVLGARLHRGDSLLHTFLPSKRAYLVSTVGGVDCNGLRLAARDGALISGESQLDISALADTIIVLVEVD